MRKQDGRKFWLDFTVFTAVIAFSYFSFFQFRRPSKAKPQEDPALSNERKDVNPVVRGPAALQKLAPGHKKVIELGCFEPGKHTISTTENSLIRIKAKLCMRSKKYKDIEAWIDQSPILIYRSPQEISSSFITLKEGANIIRISAITGTKKDSQEIEIVRVKDQNLIE